MNSFQQNLMLFGQTGDWQPTSVLQSVMGHRPIAAQLAVGVNNDHALLEFVRHYACNVSQQPSLA